jgi:hypothetical protein
MSLAVHIERMPPYTPRETGDSTVAMKGLPMEIPQAPSSSLSYRLLTPVATPPAEIIGRSVTCFKEFNQLFTPKLARMATGHVVYRNQSIGPCLVRLCCQIYRQSHRKTHISPFHGIAQ